MPLHRPLTRAVAMRALGLALLLPRAAGAQQTQVLRLGTTMSDDLTPVWYAVKAGLFKKAGLDVEMTVLPNGSAVAAGVAGGALDIGKASLVSLMNAHAKGVPIVLVTPGAMYTEKAPYAVMVQAVDANFKTGKDLEGKTIGVPALGDFNTLVTSMWVDQHGGDSKTLRFVEIPNTIQTAAIVDHRIDAAVIQNPDLAEALGTKKVKVLGLAYSAISPTFMFAGWFAMNDWAAKHPDLVKTFTRVAEEAAVYTNGHHAETAPMMADATKIPLTTIGKMDRVDTYTTLEPANFQAVISAAAKYKLLPRDFPAKEMIFTP